jgi:hypothetical protein
MIEPVPVYVWAAMQLVVAAGAGLLAAILTRAHMAVVLARQQQSLSEARALLATQHRAMEERIRATEEAARRQALDDFLSDVRVERHQFHPTMVAERVCFRNLPLTPWVEHNLPPPERPAAPRMITSPKRAS